MQIIADIENCAATEKDGGKNGDVGYMKVNIGMLLAVKKVEQYLLQHYPTLLREHEVYRPSIKEEEAVEEASKD